MSEPKLAIRGLDKSFGVGTERRKVLSAIELDLADNAFVSLVGISGCGKSTLLSIIAGLQAFDAGELTLDGAPIVKPGLDRGVVFQSYTLLPWLTARQNVEFALKAAGYGAADCRRLAAPASQQPGEAGCTGAERDEDRGETEHEEQAETKGPAAARLRPGEVGARDPGEVAWYQRQHARRGEGDKARAEGQREPEG